MKYLMSMALLTTLISCGKEMKEKPSFSSSSNDLRDKTEDEIISLKYDNDIDLHCELRVQDGIALNLNAPPQASFIWRLRRELASAKYLHYRVHDRQYVAVVRLDSPLRILDSLTFTDVEGREYHMEKTPFASVHYEVLSKDDFEKGVWSDRKNMNVVSLAENVEVPLFTLTSEDVNRDLVTEDLRCTLKTRLGSHFSQQWKILQ